MIAYVCVGADDMAVAERFYSAVLVPLGYTLEKYHGDLSYILPPHNGAGRRWPDFYVKSPVDGRAASVGNGTMVAFEARDQAQVRALHAMGLNAGGKNEGDPGFRAAYGDDFFVCYLRDPQGNKIALFSSNPDDPRRGD